MVTSLHGEALGEHGVWFGHGSTLYEEELTIPILFKGPRVKGAYQSWKDSLISILDIAPTTLALLGLPDDSKQKDGRNLATYLFSGHPPPNKYMAATITLPPYSRAVVSPTYFKLILHPPRPPQVSGFDWWPVEQELEFYSLRKDPMETSRQERSLPGMAHQLQIWLRDTYPPLPGTPPAEDTSRIR